MGLPILTPWADNVLRSATISLLDGSLNSEFPLASLVDGDQTEACQLTTPEGMFAFDLLSATALGLFAVLHHNIPAGTVVKLRGYSAAPTDENTAHQVEVSVTVGAIEASGFRPNFWFNVAAVTSNAYQYWAVVVPTGSALNLIIGECWASATQREIPNGIQLGSRLGLDVETIRHQTYGGLGLKARKDTPVEVFDARLIATDDDGAEWAEIRDFFLELNGASSIALLIPDADDTEVHQVELLQGSLRGSGQGAEIYGDIAFSLRECSRGLVWD